MDINNTRGTADALPAFEVFGNTAEDRPFHNAAVRGKKFHPHQVVWMEPGGVSTVETYNDEHVAVGLLLLCDVMTLRQKYV
ncbi:hypothetical protein RR46_12317 [Papilio xuthus]|uniref:Uncharacterized protein n=1 Tax=Papilio xuthus TaxID=66420 RepID=A0A194PSK0_PAPXU|nr:hypothetical protein RR46_12317 [Papilio xuthus]